jgi:hypothetical protein
LKGRHSQFGRRSSNIFRFLNLFSCPSDLENRRRPDSGTERFTSLSVSVSYSSLLLLPFAKFINCIFCKVLLFDTIVTACFFQLLLLNGYVKHSGYFGSFLATYCVTLIQGPLLSGPIVGLKGRTYNLY